jgi:triosephosphate isomerase (TIM)
MHGTISESLVLLTGLEHHLKARPDIDVVIAPPATALYSLGIALQESPFQLCAQNCHWEEKGAFTGEVSPAFLAEIGCTYVLVGHSERRQLFGDTDDWVNKKMQAVLRNGMTPVLCVGEQEADRDAGRTWDVVDAQLKHALYGFHMKELEQLAIAYEPVWAIGTGKTANPGQISEVHAFIRNTLEKLFDAPSAHKVPILYGGSVKGSNVEGLAAEPSVNGCLVGGASLDAVEFSGIVRAMDRPVSEEN